MPWNQQSWVHVFWHPVESVVLPFQGTLYVMNAFWTTDQKWSNWLGKSVYLSKHFQCAFFIFYSLSVWILADAKWLSVSGGKNGNFFQNTASKERDRHIFFRNILNCCLLGASLNSSQPQTEHHECLWHFSRLQVTNWHAIEFILYY